MYGTVVSGNGEGDIGIGCPRVFRRATLQAETGLGEVERDIYRKARVIEVVGAYTGWAWAVSPDGYGVMSERLEEARERFLGRDS
jgi:hypothetical protein